MKINSISMLFDVWNKYNLDKVIDIDWEEFLQKYLYKATRRIEVRSVNQSSGASALDYHNYKDIGMRVIAVGGNSLSRGLTLEGLMVSYFYRNTMMYDTLLQMGRWFPQYILCKKLCFDSLSHLKQHQEYLLHRKRIYEISCNLGHVFL